MQRDTKESLTSQRISHQTKHMGGKQTSRTNQIDFNYGYKQNFNIIEGNNFVTVLLLNYDLLSSLRYMYESMLSYLHLFSLICTVM